MKPAKQIVRWTGFFVGLALFVFNPRMASAHPMGNFSVNHYAKIRVGQRSIEILYLIDMADIPTSQEIRQFDITPRADDPSVSQYLDKRRRLLQEGLAVEVDGRSIPLDEISHQAVTRSLVKM